MVDLDQKLESHMLCQWDGAGTADIVKLERGRHPRKYVQPYF